eukprot:c18884_g1_i4.p1 GENE.c18884_g1_i4~~c18884_g1_i4.p1  ORF type:complete len:487 (-),score=111.86 c18884_g1_i4:95-1555(-)
MRSKHTQSPGVPITRLINNSSGFTGDRNTTTSPRAKDRRHFETNTMSFGSVVRVFKIGCIDDPSTRLMLNKRSWMPRMMGHVARNCTVLLIPRVAKKVRPSNMKHTLTAIKQKIAHKKDEYLHDNSYETCQEKFLVHYEAAKRFQSQLSDYVRSLSGLATACGIFGTEITTFYGTVTGTQGIPRAGTTVTKVLGQMEANTTSVLNEAFTAKLMGEWNEYVGILHALNKKIPERKQCLANFDYYKIKVADLQGAQDAKQTAGKEVTDKDRELLSRNHDKLSAAERAYNEINAELVRAFQLICDDSANTLNQLLLGLVDSLNAVFGSLAANAAELRVIVQNPNEFDCQRRDPAYYRLRELYAAQQPEQPAGTISRLASKFKRSASVAATPRVSVDETPAQTHAHAINEPPPSHASFHRQSPQFDADPELKAGKRVRGLYAFDGTNDDELSFQVGEEMTLVELFEEGWWTVENNKGARGIVPYNYVEVI